MTDHASHIRRLRLDGVSLDRGQRRLLTGVTDALAAGEALSLTGANGAGKTSLLRAIAGLLPLAAGRITFDGPEGEIEADTARSEGLHLLAHQDGLKTSRTAGEELDFWARWLGGACDLATAVEMFHLGPLLGLEVRKLSAGQRRRLALARLLAAPRPLWLLDEPMAPLDAAMRRRLGEVMQRHLDGGGLILAAVHDPLPVPSRTLPVGVVA